jgi:2-polyprenyl-3-methyl-5-hydroxy-6-metoxy-1,4-benzoquinol methylase
LASDSNRRTSAHLEYLSQPLEVSMADEWYDISTAEHFWIVWRLQALLKHSADLPPTHSKVLEVGCGHGVFRDQLESHLKYTVDGCDLNEEGLSKAQSGIGRLFLYNILEMHSEMRAQYEAIFLMDVIEHIDREQEFVDACRFHCKDRGLVIINVPALCSLYSKYDRAAGHVRRYNRKMVQAMFDASGIEMVSISYWGLPMIPLLILRKYYLRFVSDDRIIEKGFAPPSQLAHKLLNLCRIVESKIPLPPPVGTSIIAIGRLR